MEGRVFAHQVRRSLVVDTTICFDLQHFFLTYPCGTDSRVANALKIFCTNPFLKVNFLNFSIC